MDEQRKNTEERSVRPRTLLRRQILLGKISVYVDAHLTEKVTLKDLADYCCVSISTITQLFQKEGGTTFHQYLTQRRMEAAMTLIRSGTPLEEAGKCVGYGDHSTFYRAFRSTFGMSPREYQREYRRKSRSK